MPKRTQKVRTTPTGEWMYCSFSVHPEEIAAYREIAKMDGRSLSWWIRDALNKAVALIKEKKP